MTSRQVLLEGLELMQIGMGLVFVFLALLIGCIRLMSVLLQRATVHEAVGITATRSQTSASQMPDADTLAAIQAAVQQHRSHHVR